MFPPQEKLRQTITSSDRAIYSLVLWVVVWNNFFYRGAFVMALSG
jgi:hypothetical protein